METLTLMDSVSGLIPFAEHWMMAITLTALFVSLYLWQTPHRELQLIEEGHLAPAISLSGALLGFAIALSSAISHSQSLLDMSVWALVALIVQSGVFWMMRFLLPKLYEGLLNNQTASALLLGTLSITAGLLSAACMSY